MRGSRGGAGGREEARRGRRRDCWLRSTGPGDSCPAAPRHRLALRTARCPRPAAPRSARPPAGRGAGLQPRRRAREPRVGGRTSARARREGRKGRPELGQEAGRRDSRRDGRGWRVAPRPEGPRRRQEERGQSAGAPAAGLAPAQLRVHSVNSCVRGARAPGRAAPIAPAFLFHVCESRVRRRRVTV